jgi:hypothetical protein
LKGADPCLIFVENTKKSEINSVLQNRIGLKGWMWINVKPALQHCLISIPKLFMATDVYFTNYDILGQLSRGDVNHISQSSAYTLGWADFLHFRQAYP